VNETYLQWQTPLVVQLWHGNFNFHVAQHISNILSFDKTNNFQPASYNNVRVIYVIWNLKVAFVSDNIFLMSAGMLANNFASQCNLFWSKLCQNTRHSNFFVQTYTAFSFQRKKERNFWKQFRQKLLP
jgi:hypothetical protein